MPLYLLHPPIALERLDYDGHRTTYRGRRLHPQTGRDHVTLDPLEMLARLCQHIPPPRFHLTRLYGAYSNRTRARRKRHLAAAAEKTDTTPQTTDPELTTPTQRELRRQWARLIAKVFEVDPLRCRCGGTMRVVAFLLDPAVIRKILAHRARIDTRAHGPPQNRPAPPATEGATVSTHSGNRS